MQTCTRILFDRDCLAHATIIISTRKFKIRGNVIYYAMCSIIMFASLDIIGGLYIKMRLYYCDVLCSCLASSVNIISRNIMRHEPSPLKLMYYALFFNFLIVYIPRRGLAVKQFARLYFIHYPEVRFMWHEKYTMLSGAFVRLMGS